MSWARVGWSLSLGCNPVEADLDSMPSWTQPGVREQQKGTLPLSKGAKGKVTLYTAFTPYPGPSDLPPKHLWEFSTSL